MSYRLLVVALLAACSSEGATGIGVYPGPEIQIKEGETSSDHELLFDGEASKDFGLAFNDMALAAKTIDAPGGGTLLQVTPLCAAIASGDQRPAVEHIIVTKLDTDATPVTVTIDITSWELGDCAVKVEGWPGPCEQPPMNPPSEIHLDPMADTQSLCIRVTVPDSLDPLDVTFPDWGSLEPLELHGDNLIGVTSVKPETATLTAVGVPAKFRGRKDLDVRWGEAGLARIPIIAGEPGDGVLRLRTGPASVSEYGPAVVKLATSYYEKPGTVACVRALPSAPTMSLVVRSDLSEVIQQGHLSCGVSINSIELVTSLDSQPLESIDLTLERCTLPSTCGTNMTASYCCEQPGAIIEPIPLDSGSIPVPSNSLTERIAVGEHGERECLDLDGDDLPEIVVRDAAGVRMHSPSGTLGSIRYQAPASFSYAQSMLAFRWFDGTVAKPMLIAEVPNTPGLHALTVTGWDPKVWPRPVSPDPPFRWVPVGPARDAGASYVIVKKSDTVLGFSCISDACNGQDAPSIDVSAIDVGGPAQSPTRISAYSVADIDGDLDLDLIVVLDSVIPIGASRPIKLYAFDLMWNGHEIAGKGPPTSFLIANPAVAWGQLQFATLPRAGTGDLIYILALDPDDQQHEIVEVSACPGCSTSRSIQTISRAFEIATVRDKLYVATDLGIWELSGASWLQRDPERARTQQSTIPIPNVARYGEILRGCLSTTVTARPSILFEAEEEARWTFADVVVDTLPEL